MTVRRIVRRMLRGLVIIGLVMLIAAATFALIGLIVQVAGGVIPGGGVLMLVGVVFLLFAVVAWQIGGE